jgi:hypothetical protein
MDLKKEKSKEMRFGKWVPDNQAISKHVMF